MFFENQFTSIVKNQYKIRLFVIEYRIYTESILYSLSMALENSEHHMDHIHFFKHHSNLK